MNEGVLNMALGGLKHRLAGYERMLAKTRFLAGDKLTVVDMFHLPFGEAMIQVRITPELSTPFRPCVSMLCYMAPTWILSLANAHAIDTIDRLRAITYRWKLPKCGPLVERDFGS